MSEFELKPETANEVLNILRERALTRLLGAYNFDWRDYLEDEEIVAYDAALALAGNTQADLAPELTGQTLAKVGKVLIEVYGGVADVTAKPDGIEVEIRDHDNEEA